MKEQSRTDRYSAPLYISSTTKPSKVVVKKHTPEHHGYVHIHSKQDKVAFHLDHVIHDLGDWPSQVIVHEENCMPSAAISSAWLEKEPVTTEEDAIVNQNASGQDQCSGCMYAVVDKTMKKLQPTKVNKAVSLSSLIMLLRVWSHKIPNCIIRWSVSSLESERIN